MVVGPLDLDRVRRAVDVLDRLLAFDGDPHADPPHRLRRVLRRAQGKEKVGQSLLLPAKLRVAERHRPLRPGRNRENARLEHPRPHPFQQRRVAVLPHDLFIRPPCFLCVQQPRRMLLAVDQQGHLMDRPFVGQRKDETRLQGPASCVLERLRRLHLGRLIDQPGVDLQLVDFVRRFHGARRMEEDRPRQPHALSRIDHHQHPLSPGNRRRRHRQGDQPARQSLCHHRSPSLLVSEGTLSATGFWTSWAVD